MPNARRQRITRQRPRREDALDLVHLPPRAAPGVAPARRRVASGGAAAEVRASAPRPHPRRVVALATLVLGAVCATASVFWLLVYQEDALRRAFFPTRGFGAFLHVFAAIGAVLHVAIPLTILRRLHLEGRLMIGRSARLALAWGVAGVFASLVSATSDYVSTWFGVLGVGVVAAGALLLLVAKSAAVADA